MKDYVKRCFRENNPDYVIIHVTVMTSATILLFIAKTFLISLLHGKRSM